MENRDNAISVAGLTKRFGSFTAVDHITFDVGRGEIFGFLGANGAGKTTAMRMLCGLSVPTSGTGRVAGYDIISQPEEVKRHIGYMSQKFSLYGELTVKENLRLFSSIYGMSAAVQGGVATPRKRSRDDRNGKYACERHSRGVETETRLCLRHDAFARSGFP